MYPQANTYDNHFIVLYYKSAFSYDFILWTPEVDEIHRAGTTVLNGLGVRCRKLRTLLSIMQQVHTCRSLSHIHL